MRKSLFIMAPAALALLASVGSAQAASNAEITITANVVSSTCDLSVSKSNLDLGNFATSTVTAAGIATPVASSVKDFSIALSNCEEPTQTAAPSITVSGQTVAGYSNLFNSTGTNNGIMVSLASAPTAYITNGQSLPLTAATTSADLNGQTLNLQAGLASSSATPAIGAVSAPVLFSFVYN